MHDRLSQVRSEQFQRYLNDILKPLYHEHVQNPHIFWEVRGNHPHRPQQVVSGLYDDLDTAQFFAQIFLDECQDRGVLLQEEDCQCHHSRSLPGYRVVIDTASLSRLLDAYDSQKKLLGDHPINNDTEIELSTETEQDTETEINTEIAPQTERDKKSARRLR